MNTKESKVKFSFIKDDKKNRKKLIWILSGSIAAVVLLLVAAILMPGRIKETKEGIVYSKLGVMAKDKWVTVNHKTYYFDKDGHAYTEWKEIGKDAYYFDKNGVLQKGWLELDENKYYLQENDGKQVKGPYFLDGCGYYFSKEDGVLLKGAIKEDDKLVACADEEGKLYIGVHDVEGKTYCFNEKGLTQTGWVTIDEKKSYCQEDGTAVKGRQTIEGKNYYFDENAQLQTGWIQSENGDRFYASEDGVLLSGMQSLEGKRYYFNEEGVLQTGWININDDERYYASEDGSFLTGEQNIHNVSYTFDENGKMIEQEGNNRKMVALTFDDGPSVNTDRILDILQMYNCKATFFVVGSRVSNYSSQLKRAYDLGCEIGSHTFNHKYLTSLSDEELHSELDQTNAAVSNITGQNTTCLRPPGGFYNDEVIQKTNCPLLLWSIDTLDWKSKNPQQIISIATTNIQDGDIILMHDLYSTTADAVGEIVPALLSQGFEIVTVTELLDAHGGVFNGKVYFSANKVK